MRNFDSDRGTDWDRHFDDDRSNIHLAVGKHGGGALVIGLAGIVVKYFVAFRRGRQH